MSVRRGLALLAADMKPRVRHGIVRALIATTVLQLAIVAVVLISGLDWEASIMSILWAAWNLTVAVYLTRSALMPLRWYARPYTDPAALWKPHVDVSVPRYDPATTSEFAAGDEGKGRP